MAEYSVHISKMSNEVLGIKISKKSNDRAVVACVSGDELAQWIIEKGGLNENLMTPEEAAVKK